MAPKNGKNDFLAQKNGEKTKIKGQKKRRSFYKTSSGNTGKGQPPWVSLPLKLGVSTTEQTQLPTPQYACGLSGSSTESNQIADDDMAGPRPPGRSMF